ncbi:MAG: hypothetical protein SF187_22725 [Deltaproteobacteria bacterium]|nr:hypothetical protein [Deltaproteobacteria bacterium]
MPVLYAKAALLLLIVLPCGYSGNAQAQPARVAEAQRHIENAEFREALALLQTTAAAGQLSRIDVLQFLELRALVYWALGQAELARQDLRWLAALHPNHAFPPNINPDLPAQFEREKVRQPPLRLVVEAKRVEGSSVSVTGGVINAPENLIESVRLSARVGTNPWRSDQGSNFKVSALPNEPVEYFAEALGLGGSVLLRTEPAMWREPLPPQTVSPSAAHKSSGVWWWVVAGVAATSGILTAVLLMDDEPTSTTPLAPVVTW